MSTAASVDVSAWAFGPEGGVALRDRLRHLGVAAGVVAAIGVAGALGFVAFVSFAGTEDSPVPASSASDSDGTTTSVAPVLPQPLLITDLRLTDSVDAATGEPGSSLSTFGVAEPVHLWLSFDAGDAAGSLTAVWFRGDQRIARLKAPLPDVASQMVFPLPQVAVDQPGSYRVEVRSNRDVVAAETFEVTNG
ncbi:MAG: hypothetical protein ACRDH9_07835 [Actinomycetota bacterium]